MKGKNRKILIMMTLLKVAAIMILTGSYAWELIKASTTGDKDYYFDYMIKLMNDSTDPLLMKHNWKPGERLIKPIYGTSSYLNTTIKHNYDALTSSNANTKLSDTWVRIKIQETLITDHFIHTIDVNQLDSNHQLKSHFNQYFQFINETETEIITLHDWDGIRRGRFWILDENTGWLYWAQPVNYTTLEDHIDQTTDLLLESVELLHQPSKTWRYNIKATLDAMDVELDGYRSEGAWHDISDQDKIYPLFTELVYIYELNFPDATFRDALKKFDKNNDGKFDKQERYAITDMDVSSAGISDITGIEFFPNLTYLNAYNNQLTQIDTSKNTALTVLNVRANKLTALDISMNKSLVYLYANSNQLTQLDLSQNTALYHLNAKANQLTNIDLSKNLQLASIDIASNKLSSINLNNNTKLLELMIASNQLTALDVSKNTKLKKLAVENNRLTFLNVSSNSALTTLTYSKQKPDGQTIVELEKEITLLGWNK